MKRRWISLVMVAALAAAFGCASDPTVRVKAGDRNAGKDPYRPAPRQEAVVPFQPVLGDYAAIGVKTPEGRTDIPRLMAVLKEMGARDYFHLVWAKPSYPESWEDFKLLAPEFQKNGMRLWLYITPPSEPPAPEPFGFDYVRWAAELAALASKFPCIAGLCVDDFNGNVDLFTPSYCRDMMAPARRTAPHLALLVTNYFGYYEDTMAEHVRRGVIDGVVFPYFYPQKNHSDTALLAPQIETYRRWLDEQTRKGGRMKRTPLIVMIYALKHSQSPDEPAPEFVKRALEIGLEATAKGLADGVTTYCLPKDKPEFVRAVAAVYKDKAPS